MTYLYYNGLTRIESDDDVILTLIRKGWLVIPEPSQPNGQWDGNEWIYSDIEISEPDWVRFKLFLLSNIELKEVLVNAFSIEPVAVLALSPTFTDSANKINYFDFNVAWTTLKSKDLIPESMLLSLGNFAVECNLPSEFICIISCPVASRIGQLWDSPDGSRWVAVQSIISHENSSLDLGDILTSDKIEWKILN